MTVPKIRFATQFTKWTSLGEGSQIHGPYLYPFRDKVWHLILKNCKFWLANCTWSYCGWPY